MAPISPAATVVVKARKHPRPRSLLYRLTELGVPFWVVERGRDKEFHRPTGWQQITGEGNLERLDRWREGDALSANTGEIVAVVDVDPRNGRSV